eukprot:2745815-Prymnesium_polylepis.1
MEVGRRSNFSRIVGHAQGNLTQTNPAHPGPKTSINSSLELLMLIRPRRIRDTPGCANIFVPVCACREGHVAPGPRS